MGKNTQQVLDRHIKRVNEVLYKREELTYRILTSKTVLQRQFLSAIYVYNELKCYNRLNHKVLMAATQGLNAEQDPIRKAHLARIKHHQIHTLCLSRKEQLKKVLQMSGTVGLREKAKQAGDYTIVEKSFNTLLETLRKSGQIKAPQLGLSSAYEALMDEYDPGRIIANYDALTQDLKTWIPQQKDQRSPKTLIDLPKISKEVQFELSKEILKHIGVDLSKTRFQEGMHPTTFGQRDRVLMTMCYHEDNFIIAALHTLHEGGHALLRQNTPENLSTGPAIEVNSQTTDESAALMLENALGRTTGFAKFLVTTLKDKFGITDPGLTEKNIYNYLTSQTPASMKRTESAQLLYPLHISIRYALGRQLIDNNLSAEDLPHAWQVEEKKRLGQQQPFTKERALQDIHWFGGRVGYFPCYLSGTLMSIQVYEAAVHDNPHIAEATENFDPKPLINWLQQNFYNQFPYHTSDGLVQKITGQPISAEAFKRQVSKQLGLEPEQQKTKKQNRKKPPQP